MGRWREIEGKGEWRDQRGDGKEKVEEERRERMSVHNGNVVRRVNRGVTTRGDQGRGWEPRGRMRSRGEGGDQRRCLERKRAVEKKMIWHERRRRN